MKIVDFKFLQQDKILKIKHHCVVMLLTMKYSLSTCTVSFNVNVLAKCTPTRPLSRVRMCQCAMKLTICLHTHLSPGCWKIQRSQGGPWCLGIWTILNKGVRRSGALAFSMTASRYVGVWSVGRVPMTPNCMVSQSRRPTSPGPPRGRSRRPG